MRVVLDANVVVSGLISASGPPGRILDAWLEGHFDLLVSPPILDEWKRVLAYSRIRERLAPQRVKIILRGIEDLSLVVPRKVSLPDLRLDPSDTIYLACAIEGRASFLVTGNLKHFAEAVKRFPALRILSPRDFLPVLG